MKSPFHTKPYKDYDEYIEHQCSKLNTKLSNVHGKAWLDRHERNYFDILRALLDALIEKKAVGFKGKTCLCVGARGEAEPRAFIERGSLAIGIDLNPVPHNCYVVTGDAARIQYPENTFDIVYTNALDHFLLIKQSLSEIQRVLKPGGIFLLVTGTPDGAKDDAYGSTYWDSEESLEQYMKEEFRYTMMSRMALEKATQGWFSHLLVLKNGK